MHKNFEYKYFKFQADFFLQCCLKRSKIYYDKKYNFLQIQCIEPFFKHSASELLSQVLIIHCIVDLTIVGKMNERDDDF